MRALHRRAVRRVRNRGSRAVPDRLDGGRGYQTGGAVFDPAAERATAISARARHRRGGAASSWCARIGRGARTPAIREGPGRRRVRSWRAWSRPDRRAAGAGQEGEPATGPSHAPDSGRAERGARAGAAGRDAAPGGNGRPAPARPAPDPCPAPAATPPSATRLSPFGTRWSPSGGLWVSIVLWSATWAVSALVPVAAHEHLVLRWLRAAADHPARTAVAGALLTLAWPPVRRSSRGEPVQGRPVAVDGERS